MSEDQEQQRQPRGEVVRVLARDALGLAAVGAITFGCWLVYEPAGFIVGGALVLAGVIAVSRGRSDARNL